MGWRTKKDLQAIEQKRPEVAALRHIWITRRQPFMANMLTRVGFIDETSVKTNMAKTTGWAPRGERLVDHAPFGHWHIPHRMSVTPPAIQTFAPSGKAIID